jgi:hypothetical protein
MGTNAWCQKPKCLDKPKNCTAIRKKTGGNFGLDRVSFGKFLLAFRLLIGGTLPAVAALVLFAAATGAGIVAADFFTFASYGRGRASSQIFTAMTENHSLLARLPHF